MDWPAVARSKSHGITLRGRAVAASAYPRQPASMNETCIAATPLSLSRKRIVAEKNRERPI